MARTSLIVDLDGTVWDSRPWFDALLHERAAPAIGSSNAARALADAGWTRGAFRKACSSGQPPLGCYRGVAHALAAVAASGVQLGVVTNLPRWLAEPMLASVALDRHIGVVIGWGDVSRRKPHPDPLLLACERLRVEPTHTWYVGDDVSDAECAVRAGARFAWASWGYTPAPPAGTAVVLRGGRDIAALFEGQP